MKHRLCFACVRFASLALALLRSFSLCFDCIVLLHLLSLACFRFDCIACMVSNCFVVSQVPLSFSRPAGVFPLSQLTRFLLVALTFIYTVLLGASRRAPSTAPDLRLSTIVQV